MAFSIASIFGGANPPAPANAAQPGAPTAPTPGNIPDNAGATNPNNPTVPANQTQAANQTQEPVDPLKQFEHLWNPRVDASGKEVKPQAKEFSFGEVNPDKIMEVASKANFAGTIPKETMQRIAQGGDGAVEAFAEAMNRVSQTVFGQSNLATTKIVEAALKKQQELIFSQLPGLIKKNQLSDNLVTKNPQLSHPSVQPIIKAMEQSFSQKFPNATATQLTEMAEQYVLGLGKVFSPASEANADTNSSKTGETDWSSFFPKY